MKKASVDASSPSSEAFSVPVLSPFNSSERKIQLKDFLLEYPNYSTLKGEKLFETIKSLAFEWNVKSSDKINDFEVDLVVDEVIQELLKPLDFSPSLSFAELMSQQFPKARYTVEPFFESGTVNMVSAPPNTWKSWLLFLMSSHIASGSAVFDRFETEQSKVMIVNEEDSFRAIQDRFKILNITDNTLPIFFRVANGSKFESKFINKLLEELKEKQIKVVIFDSLRSMHEADENDSTAMQIILDQMKKISREGITVIFTHHHRKKGMFEKGSTAESSRGSSAINAAISGHISLDEEERDSGLYLIIRHLKSKAGEKLPAFEVKIKKTEDKVEFIYDGEFKASEKKLTNTKDSIISVLSDGKWRTRKDFEETIVVGKNIMIQAIQVLKNDGMILAINRKQAISKSIPVKAKGHPGEMYYSLNTEETEILTREDEEVINDSFDNY